MLRRFTVVAGGPGTGKTTTVARIVALLAEQAGRAGAPPPLVALAAPTGKAAARLEEAVHERGGRLDVDAGDPRRACSTCAPRRCTGCSAGGPDSHSRFRHDRGNRLPHDVVIVDETSMVSLSLMARLVEAVRPDARLVLVGDPGQLTSIEAGAVLGDIVGAGVGAATGSSCSSGSTATAAGSPTVAEAIRRGDADGAVAALRAVRGRHLDRRPTSPTATPTSSRRCARAAVDAARAVIEAARAGDAALAIARARRLPRSCARTAAAPTASPRWMARIERWLAAEVDGFGTRGRWYAGPPAARDRERLRPAPLQRRHRRRGRDRAGGR